MPAVNMAIPIPGSIHPQAAPQSILLNSSSNPSGNGKMSIKARGKKRARIADVTNDHHHNNLEYSDATTSSSSSSSRPKVSKKKLADSNGSGPGGGRTALLPPPAQRRRSSPPIPMDASTSSSQPPITSTTTMEAASANGEGSIILGLGRGMYLSFVESALAEKDQGEVERYNQLVSQFRSLSSTSQPRMTIQPPSKTLRPWLEAMTHHVSSLRRSHSSLVNAIVGVPWTTMDDAFANVYVRFLGTLVSAKVEYLPMVLEKCVKDLRFAWSTEPDPASQPTPQAPTQPQITRRQHYDRIHILLQTLLTLVPTLPNTLWPIIEKWFPAKRATRESHVVYLRNVLRISGYCPELVEDVLEAVVGRAVRIDVEIQVELDEFEDEEGVLDEEVFRFNAEAAFDSRLGAGDDESDSDSDTEAGGDEVEDLDFSDIDSDGGGGGGGDDDDLDDDDERRRVEESRRKSGGVEGKSPEVLNRLKELAAKLDVILLVIFDHLHQQNAIWSPPNFSRSGGGAGRGGGGGGTGARLVVDGDEGLKEAFEATLPEISKIPDGGEGLMGVGVGPLGVNEDQGRILRQSIFGTLLSIFDRIILRTFKTRYTQFILFWYTSLDPTFGEIFTGTLVNRALLEPNLELVTRVASAGYIASFISRAGFIGKGVVRRIMCIFCRFLEDEVGRIEGLIGGPGSALAGSGQGNAIPQQCAIFYAVAQAAFYVFCFRWRDLLEEVGGSDPGGEDSDEEEEEDEGKGVVPGERRWMEGLDSLKRVVESSLNPLKVCSPAVVSQFTRMAHKTQFMYCYPIVRSNKRQQRYVDSPVEAPTPTTATATATGVPSHFQFPFPPLTQRSTSDQRPSLLLAGAGAGSGGAAGSRNDVASNPAVKRALEEAQFDSHFPFDPFKLPCSAGYVRGIYREWDGGGFEEDDDDEDEDEEDEDEDGGGEDGGDGGLTLMGSRRRNLTGSQDDLGVSFEGMSLSPEMQGRTAMALTAM